MSVLSTGTGVFLTLLFASTASAQFSTQKVAPGAPMKGGTAQKVVTNPAPVGGRSFTPPAGSTALLVGGGDNCAVPDAIAGPGSVLFDLTTATTGTEGQSEALCYFFGNTAIDSDVWFAWTATSSGTALVSTCATTTVDTKIAVYAGAGCPAPGAAIACNDDACGLQSSVSFTAVNGNVYMIQIGTFPGAAAGSGNFDVSVNPTPINDDCASPTVVAGFGPHPFNNVAATTGAQGQGEALCYFFGLPGIAKDVWFTWTATASGVTRASTCGQATHDTKIAVYAGAGCPSGAAIACNDDACALQSTAQFNAIAGNTYTIQLGSFDSTAGAIGGVGTFTMDTLPPPTTNDSCTLPQAIAGLGLFPFDNSLATTGIEGQNEAICLAFGSTAINNDLWFAWTAPISGMAQVSTCGLTGIDTRLAAYPGSSCPADGTSLACNDDICGLQSTIDFPVTVGQTYMIQVGTFSAAAFGSGNFSIDIPGGSAFTAYCFGDGTGGLCPCGNTGGPGGGCDNNTGSGGASLSGSGSNSIAAGDMVLSGQGAQPGQPGLYFQGDNAIAGGNGIPNGDGLRCAGGNVRRIQIRQANASGASSTTVNIAVQGAVLPGQTKRYQWWYRNPSPAAPCGTTFNLSNGLETTWIP